MIKLNFDASKVDPSIPFEALPSDKYLAEIVATEELPTKAGDGAYLKLEFVVLDGEYKGRKVWDRLCLNHPSAETVKIARANLSAICHAVGVMHPEYASDLHHIPLIINVKAKKDQSSGQIFNEIKGYSKRESLVTPPPSVQAQQYPQTPVDQTTPPWERS